jgi:hypothetical protein
VISAVCHKHVSKAIQGQVPGGTKGCAGAHCMILRPCHPCRACQSGHSTTGQGHSPHHSPSELADVQGAGASGIQAQASGGVQAGAGASAINGLRNAATHQSYDLPPPSHPHPMVIGVCNVQKSPSNPHRQARRGKKGSPQQRAINPRGATSASKGAHPPRPPAATPTPTPHHQPNAVVGSICNVHAACPCIHCHARG